MNEDNIQPTDEKLMNFITRIETLNEEKKGIGDDIRDVFHEAKSEGYSPKMMREMIKLRRKSREERMLEEAEIEVYRAAIGLE